MYKNVLHNEQTTFTLSTPEYKFYQNDLFLSEMVSYGLPLYTMQI